MEAKIKIANLKIKYISTASNNSIEDDFRSGFNAEKNKWYINPTELPIINLIEIWFEANPYIDNLVVRNNVNEWRLKIRDSLYLTFVYNGTGDFLDDLVKAINDKINKENQKNPYWFNPPEGDAQLSM